MRARVVALLTSLTLALSAIVSGPGLGLVTASAPRSAAIDHALANVSAQPAAAHFGSGQVLTVRDVIVDADGATHVRFDRQYRGLRVLGGDLVVHSAPDGRLVGISQTLATGLSLTTDARLSVAAAVRAAGAPRGSSAERIIYARSAAPVLAYEVVIVGELADGTPSERHVIVDAATGATLDAFDAIQTDSGNSYFNGTVTLTADVVSGTHYLRDPSRGNQYTCDYKNRQVAACSAMTDADGTWGDSTLGNRQTVAVDAQFGTAETWDYYQGLGRNGISNDGKGAYSRVHYGRKYNNAFWSASCFCMTYGDGDGKTFNPFDSIDVAGHEMTHGVTSRTANLTYSGESGGLNEATSDIFGTMVEYFAYDSANTRSDVPDYMIGERLYVVNNGHNGSETKALRYMWDPSLDTRSASCWYSGVGSLDVHYSSGVANHFFYLLAEGSSASPASPVCSNSANVTSVAGIGRAAAQQVWYRALTAYMTSNTDYHGARTATLSAATALYGAGSVQYAAVNAAWAAVNVTAP